MHRVGWASSLVTRMVVCFCLGGVIVSAAVATLEYRRSWRLAEVAHSQQMLVVVSNLQHVLRTMLGASEDGSLSTALDIFRQDPRITAARFTPADGRVIVSGPWPQEMKETAQWTLLDGGARGGGGLKLDRPTLLVAPFAEGGAYHDLELILDGPYLRRQLRQQVLEQASGMWAILGVLTLLGLLAMRRWLIAPMGRLVSLTTRNAPAAQFQQVAETDRGELGHLASSIAHMLRRLDEATAQLRERQRAFEHLYQFAPAALVSIGPDGRIVEVNRRAVELFGFPDERSMIAVDLLGLVRPEDRGRFRQSIDRMELERTHTCELRIDGAGGACDVAVELAAVHDGSGDLTHVRLSFLDVSESRRLMRQVTEQRRLLDLVVNHMAEAILLVGSDGRIITGNQRLGALLHQRFEELRGETYDPVEFWARLELLNPAGFEQRMKIAMARQDQPAQEQFDSRDGSYLFHVIPVVEETGNMVGHLWVVQDVSAQVRNRRMLEQQELHLRALRRIGRQLQTIDSVDELMERVLSELYDVFRIEALGLAIRREDTQRRTRQLLWLGEARCELPAAADICSAVADKLMPRVLPNRATSFWTDLSSGEGWTQPFAAAGLEAMAATALYNRDTTQGVLWIARRGGNRIEPHHLHLLEALGPLVAVALEATGLREQLRRYRLTDPVTDLPNRRLLNSMVAQLVNRPGHPWSLLALDIDDFAAINQRLGHATADALLRRVAEVLRENCRACDQIVRYDNDCFVVLCPDEDLNQAMYTATRLGLAVAAAGFTDPATGEMMSLSCSIGVAGSPNDHTAGELTLKIAMDRLAAAQAGGTGRIEPAEFSGDSHRSAAASRS